MIVTICHGNSDNIVITKASQPNTVKLDFHTASYPAAGSHTVDLNHTVRRKGNHGMAFPAWSIALNILDCTACWTFKSEQI